MSFHVDAGFRAFLTITTEGSVRFGEDGFSEEYMLQQLLSLVGSPNLADGCRLLAGESNGVKQLKVRILTDDIFFSCAQF